jgi:uncharacterized membrane protein YqjE
MKLLGIALMLAVMGKVALTYLLHLKFDPTLVSIHMGVLAIGYLLYVIGRSREKRNGNSKVA